MKRAIAFIPEISFDVKTNYMFNSIFNDDFFHLLCMLLPRNSQEFFDSTLIDMQVDLTKDSMGKFVERYIHLFIAEVKFYIDTYSDEMRYRIQ